MGRGKARIQKSMFVFFCPRQAPNTGATECDNGSGAVQNLWVKGSSARVPLHLIPGGGGASDQLRNVIPALAQGRDQCAANKAGAARDHDAWFHAALLRSPVSTTGSLGVLGPPRNYLAREWPDVGDLDCGLFSSIACF